MNKYILSFLLCLLMMSCVSKKKFIALETATKACEQELSNCIKENVILKEEKASLLSEANANQNRINDLKDQLEDAKKLRDAQLDQVEGLTVLSQTANRNIEETLSQLEGKDKYIKLLQAAKTKTDSLNLALAVNLKAQLKDGIDDRDVEIKVDKTVVMINLSDKMLFTSGSSNITERADDCLLYTSPSPRDRQKSRMPSSA